MKKTRLLNVYRCTLVSDKDVRHINVVANSYGYAAQLCSESISVWENKESYELVNIRLLEPVFISKSF